MNFARLPQGGGRDPNDGSSRCLVVSRDGCCCCCCCCCCCFVVVVAAAVAAAAAAAVAAAVVVAAVAVVVVAAAAAAAAVAAVVVVVVVVDRNIAFGAHDCLMKICETSFDHAMTPRCVCAFVCSLKFVPWLSASKISEGHARVLHSAPASASASASPPPSPRSEGPVASGLGLHDTLRPISWILDSSSSSSSPASPRLRARSTCV
eukprot:752274-Hanusia_phi.AAC.2